MERTRTIHVRLNGRRHELEEATSLKTVIEELQLDVGRVACELNRKILKRSEFPTTVLHDGDELELVHFVGGG